MRFPMIVMGDAPGHQWPEYSRTGHKWPSRPEGEQGDIVALTGFQASFCAITPAFQGRDRASLDREPLGVLSLEVETDAGAREIGMEQAIGRQDSAIEEHTLDAHVVMKVFNRPKIGYGATGVQVQGWRAVGRKRHAPRLDQRSRPQKAGDSAAARAIGLLHIDGASL